jgi:hypothetical protein
MDEKECVHLWVYSHVEPVQNYEGKVIGWLRVEKCANCGETRSQEMQNV